MIEGVFFHVGTTHSNPMFFNSIRTFQDPGLGFYLATIGWKTTAITLSASCLALSMAVFGRLRKECAQWTGFLAGFIVFFTLQMGLSAYKDLPYLLPVFPFLNLMAAIGLVGVTQLIAGALWRRCQPWIQPGLLALALVWQAATVLPFHPYYGTHHNKLLGGSRKAQHMIPLQDQAEGLDLAAKYLNTLPQAQSTKAAVQPRGGRFFQRSFSGATSRFGEESVDYRVYSVNQIMRGLGIESWDKEWNADQLTEPLCKVSFDGVPYVWVYGIPRETPAASGPMYEMNFRLGENIIFRGGRISEETIEPGETLTVVLYWESDGHIERDYHVFTHILSEQGKLVSQHDGLTLNGVRSMTGWRDGEIVEDIHQIPFDTSVQLGEYKLYIGMYDFESMVRLPVYQVSDQRAGEDRILLTTIRVVASVTGNE